MKRTIAAAASALLVSGCFSDGGDAKETKSPIQTKHEEVVQYVCSDEAYRKWDQLAAGLDALMGTVTAMPDDSPLTLIYTATIVNQRAILTSMTSQNAILCELYRKAG